MSTQTPRPANYDTPHGHWDIILDVRNLLRDKYRYTFRRPQEIARELGCTRAEAHLALFYWQRQKVMDVRDHDGRWYYDTAEPWKAAA